jgi:hypothetical protein
MLHRLQYINNSGIPVMSEIDAKSISRRAMRNMYSSVSIDLLSSASYMKFIKKCVLSTDTNNLLNAICNGMINGNITEDGEYCRVYTTKSTKFVMDILNPNPVNTHTIECRIKALISGELRVVGSI